MPIKYIIVKELKMGKMKTGADYPFCLDQDNVRWNIFPPLPKVEVGKAYAFHYEPSGDFNNIQKIEPIINIFKTQALKEVASINDIKRDIGIATSYSIQLCSSGKITLEDLFVWADKIYDYTQKKTDSLMPKEVK